MQFELRPEQVEATVVAGACLRAERAPTLLSAPTGSGKGVIEAELVRTHPDAALTCPNQSIAVGIAVKLTGDTGIAEGTDSAQQRTCERLRIFTDGRAKNLAARGDLTWVKRLINDEAHHGTNDTHDSLRDLLADPPRVGLTATPYRGTPNGTAELHKLYPGGIVPVVTLKRCVEAGYVSLPGFETLPLLDDETISVKGGEFVVTEVDSAIRSRVGQLVETLRQREWNDGSYHRPVTVVLGSVGACDLVAEALQAADLPSLTIVAGTRDRQSLYRRVLARDVLLLQVRAVGEGVDLPLRAMYDLSPTMSPVLWMQRVGRIMRPCGDEPGPVYYSCCHNLMRHGYLMEGLVPRSAFIKARTAWGDEWKPSRRSMTRALGNTGFGRFLPVEVPLRDGGNAWLYALRTGDGLRSYAAVLIPHATQPVYFERQDVLTGAMKKFTTPGGAEIEYAEKRVGPWQWIAVLPDLVGCASYPNDQVYPSMQKAWTQRAGRYGLDPSTEPTRKQYTLFRILEDAKLKVA